MASAPSLYKNFQLVDCFDYLNYGTIYKYRSIKTGMLITLAKIQSPIMKAYLTVRTRPADHDGIPHVLEHLIFMGSEEYPYKGILDKVANRCFAQGTNAYTQNTNTTYELTTAGKEGFYRLLPVYLDHILYPTLSDNAFITEIHHIDGSGQNSGVLAEKLKDHISPLPFFLQITSIASRFVEMFCLMDSSNVPLDLKMYIPLFLALNFSCDMKLGEDPSQYIKKENVIMSLMRESVSNSYTCGGDNDSGDGGKNLQAGLFAELVQFQLTFELDKYEKMIAWARNFLYNTVYTPEVIETKIQVLLSEVQLHKITPESVLAQASKHMVIRPESNHSVTSFLLQEQFLVQTLGKLKQDPNAVIADLYRLRDTLNKPENIRIHVTMNVDHFGPSNYEKITAPWATLCDSTARVQPMNGLCRSTTEYVEHVNRGILLGMGSTDSAFLLKVHKGITDYLNYHDRHSLSVAINFLTGEEGPFWVKLRGKGLCYGYSIISNVDKGSVGLYLSRVGNVSKAYAESKAIIEAVCSDEEPSENVLKLNESALEPAKATTVVEKLNNAETIISAAYSRFLTNTLFNGPRNFYENLQDIGKVTVSDVKRVIKQYLLPLFLENEGALFI
ncbi:predicted protein, partial [Naegleria gruberi]